MVSRTLLPAIAAMGMLAAPVLAQFDPPAQPPAATGGDISLAPPTLIAPVKDRESTTPAFLPNHIYTEPGYIGTVNSQPIFVNDIFRPIDAQLRKIAADPKNDFATVAAPIIHNQLTALVSDIVVVSAAEGTMTEEDKTRIEYFLNLEKQRILTENGGSVATAESALAKTGSSIAKELNDRRRGFIRQLYFQRHLAPRIQLTRDMALTEYERDPKRWQEPGKIELYTLTLPVSRWLREPGTNGTAGTVKTNPTAAEVANAEAQAVAAANAIEAKLKAGADFAVMVEDNNSSDPKRGAGGRWGLINSDSLTNDQLRNFAIKLPADTLGAPLLIREKDFNLSSVVIVKLGKKSDARTIPFDEAQDKIMKELQEKMIRELQDQEMRKLEKASTMEAVEQKFGVALEAAITRYATR